MPLVLWGINFLFKTKQCFNIIILLLVNLTFSSIKYKKNTLIINYRNTREEAYQCVWPFVYHDLSRIWLANFKIKWIKMTIHFLLIPVLTMEKKMHHSSRYNGRLGEMVTKNHFY